MKLKVATHLSFGRPRFDDDGVGVVEVDFDAAPIAAESSPEAFFVVPIRSPILGRAEVWS